jgi:ribosomal subunit interface protein
MEIPLQITFRGIDASAAVEARIRKKMKTLERFSPHIVGCRVVVESHHRHSRRGRLFHVRIDLTVPGAEIVISREPAEHRAHEDAYVAIRDAFDEATRRLEDYVRRRRHDVKAHEPSAKGGIVRISPHEDYGFIRTQEGRDVYFHRGSLIDADFDRLEAGDEVRFVLQEVDAECESGPHASSVRLIGKHHLASA